MRNELISHADGKETWTDPVIEAYKKDIDRTIIRENLKLTVQQRIENLTALMRGIEELNLAGRQVRARI